MCKICDTIFLLIFYVLFSYLFLFSLFGQFFLSIDTLLFHSNFQSWQMRSLPTLDPYVFSYKYWCKLDCQDKALTELHCLYIHMDLDIALSCYEFLQHMNIHSIETNFQIHLGIIIFLEALQYISSKLITMSKRLL